MNDIVSKQCHCFRLESIPVPAMQDVRMIEEKQTTLTAHCQFTCHTTFTNLSRIHDNKALWIDPDQTYNEFGIINTIIHQLII